MCFDRLAQVEVQLVMQHCDQPTLLQLARCSRATLAAASHSFVWRSLSPLKLVCQLWPQRAPPSGVSRSLLRFADLSVCWYMRSDAARSRSVQSDPDSQADQLANSLAAAEMAALAALPGLRQLEAVLFPSELSPLCAALLARLDDGGAMTSLDLCIDHARSQADYAFLAAFLARSQTLTVLRIKDTKILADDVRALAEGVRQSRSLAILRLVNSPLGDGGAATLAPAVAHCSTLTELQLMCCEIGDAGAESLVAALEQGDSIIRILDLPSHRLRPAGAASVGRLLASDFCTLHSLHLYGSHFGDEGAKSLAAGLRTNCTLTELRIRHCRISTEGTAALTAALNSNCDIPLRHLSLSYNHVDATSAEHLIGFLRSNETLEHLDLDNCWLDDAAMCMLAAGVIGAHSLRELRLDRNYFGEEGADALAEAISVCRTLTLLDLSRNPYFGDRGMAALAPGLVHLHTLDVTQCGLTGESAASLALLVQPGRELHTLFLTSNPLGTAGVVALAAALQPSSTLRTLGLSSCDVDAAGIAALGQALIRGWAVTDLSLGGDYHVDDAAARTLASALKECGDRCSLRTLGLSDCGLTSVGALALVRAAVIIPSLCSLSFNNFPRKAFPSEDQSALRAACGPNPHFELKL